jgi:transcription elongation factor GreA
MLCGTPQWEGFVREVKSTMSHSPQLQESRLQLLAQLVYFDEQKVDFLDQYYPVSPRERSKIDKMIAGYSKMIEKILADFNQDSLNSAVLIGSEMRICYLDDGYTDTFAVVFPHQVDPNLNKISFLSPIGHQLLMARKNETYPLKIPSGEVTVRIEDIAYKAYGDLHAFN